MVWNVEWFVPKVGLRRLVLKGPYILWIVPMPFWKIYFFIELSVIPGCKIRLHYSLNSHLRIFALYTKKMCLGSLQILGNPPLAHRGLSLSASPAGLLSHYGHHSTTQTSISSRQIEKVSSFCWGTQYILSNDFSLKFLIVLMFVIPKKSVTLWSCHYFQWQSVVSLNS